MSRPTGSQVAAAISTDGIGIGEFVEVSRFENDDEMTVNDVRIADGALLGDSHSDVPIAKLVSFSISRLSGLVSPYAWQLEKRYSTDEELLDKFETNGGSQGDPFNGSVQPLDAIPVEVTWESETLIESVTKDIHGDPILNTANDPIFDPTLEAPREVSVLSITRAELFFSAASVLSLANKINLSAFQGAPPRTLMAMAPRATLVRGRGLPYWRVSYRFRFNPNGWQPSVLNQGLRELINGKQVDIIDQQTKQPITVPVPLDDDGRRISPELLPGAAVFETYDVYDEVDFNAIISL